jgi:pimeloyl-ACP methyl ester carboxylesterase
MRITKRTVARAFVAVGGAVALAMAVGIGICLVPLNPTVGPIEPRQSTRYWEMSRGYRIAYTRVPATGPEGRPPVIYLHGGPGGYVHSTAIAALGRLAPLGHDVYLYDQVGSGLSDRLARPKDYTFLGHVEDLHEIVAEHLGGGPVVLVGQSFGGVIASYFLAHHPELVAQAVLTSPGAHPMTPFGDDGRPLAETLYPVPDDLRFHPPTEMPEGWSVGDWPLRAIASVAVSTLFNAKLMPDREADAFLDSLAGEITPAMVCDPRNAPPEEGGMGFYVHGNSNWFGGIDDWRPLLRESPVPVLVLQGECDFIPYPLAYEYAALAPRGEYRYVEGAGHEIWWDRPDRWVEEIARFLD